MSITHAWQDIVHDVKDEMSDLTQITHLEAARQAYLALWATLTALPLLFGLDRLFGFMNTEWTGYIAGWANDLTPGTAADAVTYYGVLELVLAALVFFMPRVGGDLFALWLVIGAISIFTIGGMAHLGFVALALAFCALAMARLSTTFHRS